MKPRCDWCLADPIYIDYHDQEWGVPLHDDQKLFEFLILDGAQAGLSWLTILKKRENYRAAFDNFDIQKVAAYTEADVQRLLDNPGIIRNRLKIASAIRNAQAVLKIIEEFGSFDAYIWGFVDGRPVQNAWRAMEELPATSAISDQMSKDLKKRGCNFVGSTICYGFMQAAGLVNDHLVHCFRHAEVKIAAPPGKAGKKTGRS
jgi:DNA-3-methyladenine glycosylase I